MSFDKCYRLWRQAMLQVPRKRARRRFATNVPRPTSPLQAGHVWAMDFVFDTCANGQVLKCLTVVDEWTREALAIDVSDTYRSRKVVDTLERLVALHGAPLHLRCDNGPEFVSHAVVAWATARGVGNAFIDPGKPWQNGLDESFNGKFRNECLSRELFRNRIEARLVIEAWRQHYNQVRPHSSLGYLTPAAFKRTNPATARTDIL